MDGRIKIHRKILDWEWYSNTNVFCTFIHCLFLANWEDKRRQGIDILRGSFITSIQHLSDEVGITPMQIRTSLDKLKSSGEITIKTTNKYTLIIVVGYDKYQSNEKEITNKITNQQQTNNKQITTTKEYKNIRTKEEYILHGEKVKLTEVEYNDLCKIYTKVEVDRIIIEMDGWCIAKGNTYKDYKQAIHNWMRKKGIGKQSEPEPGNKNHFIWYCKNIVGKEEYADLTSTKIYTEPMYMNYLITKHGFEKQKARQIRDTMFGKQDNLLID